MTTMLISDPTTALTLARYHQDDIRRSVPRRPRRWWPTRPVQPNAVAGITAVPELPGLAADVVVPAQREESAELLAG